MLDLKLLMLNLNKEIHRKVYILNLSFFIMKKSEKKSNSKKIDLTKIKGEIESELNNKPKLTKEHHKQIKEQRNPIKKTIDKFEEKIVKKKDNKNFVLTNVPGFDDLFEKGIPKGNSILVAGGAGSGKTIFSLQTLASHAKKGKKCFYMSFEESEDRLIKHMEDFGWNPKDLIKKGKLKIQRMNPFDITRNVDAMLAKQKGELLIDVDPVILPEKFKPEIIVVDSLTAIASAFTGKEENYRIYIEQLFRFFENIGATSFLVTETKQIPEIFSSTGVEEFLADGVVVFYNFKVGDARENGIEVLKMRGAKHQKKIVAMQISDKGITVYPEQEVFSEIE
jgi:KaiC/GvpD/RAD55 family RecA-like ATPase